VAELELADYAPLFTRRRIVTGMRQDQPVDVRAPLYRRLLGAAFDTLPEPIRAMHDGTLAAEGVAEVERGRGFFARLACGIAGMPPAGRDVPVKVSFTARDGREHWRRDFGGRAFASTQEAGRGRSERLLCERFGPLAIGMALVVEDGRLRLIVRRCSLFGIALPRALAPRADIFEHVQEGRFRFHVAVAHPLTGLIVAYRGWLVPRA
jgi:hypothetical protein